MTLKNIFKKTFFLFTFLVVGSLAPIANAQEATTAPSPTIAPTTIAENTEVEYIKGKIYVAKVIEAQNLTSISYAEGSNRQLIELEVQSKEKLGLRIETALNFPNSQFKAPLRKGELILIESDRELTADSEITLVGYHRQNNLLVVSFIILGLFILISGFKSNVRYIKIFFITLVSGGLLAYFYHKNTYASVIAVVAWQIIATYVFAYQIFRKRFAANLLTLSMISSLVLVVATVFLLNSIHLFDGGFFELIINSKYKARVILMYLFPMLVMYPISVVLAEQIISESIRIKREESDILKANLIKAISKVGSKTLNNIFITFFGLFFAIFITTLALASQDGIAFSVMNSSALGQILSLGFLILFNLMIFIPVVSFVTGMWLGDYEAHELISDRNLRQLEL